MAVALPGGAEILPALGQNLGRGLQLAAEYGPRAWNLGQAIGNQLRIINRERQSLEKEMPRIKRRRTFKRRPKTRLGKQNQFANQLGGWLNNGMFRSQKMKHKIEVISPLRSEQITVASGATVATQRLQFNLAQFPALSAGLAVFQRVRVHAITLMVVGLQNTDNQQTATTIAQFSIAKWRRATTDPIDNILPDTLGIGGCTTKVFAVKTNSSAAEAASAPVDILRHRIMNPPYQLEAEESTSAQSLPAVLGTGYLSTGRAANVRYDGWLNQINIPASFSEDQQFVLTYYLKVEVAFKDLSLGQ